ncbi:CCD84 protein, partial [Polypterus senegalus]|nr:CCD84 protein [Polypterus senegalus]
MVGFYCQVCRQTFFEGKGHIFGKTHQERLKRILAKFYEKVKEARKTIKNPAVVKYDGTKHLVNMWCHCCQQEVLKHMTNNNVTVLHGGLLEHMASAEHKKKTGAFWWECNADQKLKSKFLVSEEEIENSAFSCGYIGQVVEEDTRDTTLYHLEEASWEDVTHPLTFIGHQDASGGGNIHSGATPPWLMDDPEEGSSDVKQIGPSHEEFVKHKELEKLRKLPPNRVGANFDHASQTDAGWLPSFGRVWNSGRRWQSRHQFRAEEGTNKSGQKRKKDDPCKERKKPKQEPWDSSHNS